MTWTVSRRILVGFSFILILLAALGGLAIWALRSTTATFENASRQRTTALIPALRAESVLRNANSSYLRYLLEARDADREARDSLNGVIVEIVTQLRDSASTAEHRAQWQDALALHGSWKLATDSSMAARRTGLADVNRLRTESAAPLRRALELSFHAAVVRETQAADAMVAEGEATAASAKIAIAIGVILALIIGIISAALLNGAITRPLQQSTSVIASGSAQILAATTEQAASANETLAAVSETVATVDEVAQTAEQAAQRARSVAESAQRAAELGKTGRRAVEESVTGMQQVREQVESIGRSILTLADQAQAIGEIITSVNDIAEQTNLLALNAAVEAARAGDAGRGFSVVASEIRNLAEQSKRSTVQVRQILGEIQRATGAAVMATEQGTKQVTAAGKQVSESGETIRTLANAVQEASQTAAQIVASAGQQALGMEQIRHAVKNIQEATQQNLTASRQSEQAAQDLTKLGGRLLALVGSGSA
jgi:methyl-accepting chemotaxis protein